jgi:HK97 family phage prohead protease
MKREFRTFKIQVRKKDATKPTQVEGHAAVFNQLSVDFGGWRERIMPGAFKRAIAEKQDVFCLINHDSNLVLGRTISGTLALSEDKDGLAFDCDMPATTYANDLAAVMDRGDMDKCSFGFISRKATWSEEPDPDDPKEQIIVRQIEDCDLFDVSIVTYPAYPQTDANTRAELRSLAIEDAPADIRKKLEAKEKREEGDTANEAGCYCDCPECQDNDCQACSDPECEDPNCVGSTDRSRARARVRAIRASL